ncbi:MAG TPA: RibD family protein [Caulobacteraceae bacterium]|nr:RibD family protein [Caulobacteraceae bacterium]
MRLTLKLATSLDGKIATASGESRWITGEASREQGHRLRAIHQAVMVGVETVIADDPQLTVRLKGYVGAQPARIVLDSRQRIPLASKLVTTAGEAPTIVISARPARAALTEAGVEVITVDPREGRVDPAAALAVLARRGFSAVMLEGGGQVAASFLSVALVDAMEWFRAPMVLGEEGRPAIGAFVLKDLTAAPRFRRIAVEPLGEDLWERYERS